MSIRIDDDKIIFTENESTYTFNAHGENPRPSLFPITSVGGKHLSDRDPNKKLEKYTAVQDACIGNGMAAWYVQEFLSDGLDYKLSKRSAIYLGDFTTGEEKIIYKGECYGDIAFYENDLFFNIGNKIAVYHLLTEETEVLFKHSGIKKNDLRLHITPRRIFYQHWTHSNNNTMWYDRETKEVVNPHFGGIPQEFLDDVTIIYQGLDHVWVYDVEGKKKKRFFSNKEESVIFDMVLEFFSVPKEYYANYHTSCSGLSLKDYTNGRVYFDCCLSYMNGDMSFEEKMNKCYSLGLPSYMRTNISADRFKKDIRIEATAEDIQKEDQEEVLLNTERVFKKYVFTAVPKGK